MPNPDLFRTRTPAPVPNAVNNAGGNAYSTDDMHALAQLACTGVIHNTYYASASDQLKQTLELCAKVTPADVARIAVYARTEGFMKDMPTLLLTFLFSLKDQKYFNAAFPYVIDNVGQLRNFVQMVRSNVTGRKSLGSSGKRAIATMLNTISADKLFWQSVGAGMSLADVLKLAHVRPLDKTHDAFFAYTIGKNDAYDFDDLPESVRHFELFKRNEFNGVPAVPFQKLTSLNLTKTQWRQVAKNMSWNQLRFNLNQLGRKGLFEDPEFQIEIANILRDENRVLKGKALPFTLYNTFANLDSTLPALIRNAVGAALEISVRNAPVLPGKTLVLVDSSGSMTSPVTGYRAGLPSTTMTCVAAASYFAAALLKANPNNVTVVPFDTQIHQVDINPLDSVSTITSRLARHGGGTDVSCGINWALSQRTKYDQIIILSDNESWVDGWNAYKGTAIASAISTYRKTKGATKLLCVNIQAGTTTVQVPDNKDTINIGGLNDNVFKVFATFTQQNGRQHWTSTIDKLLPELR